MPANIDGDPRDFDTQVGYGLVPGYTRVAALGNNPSITTSVSVASPQDIWSGGGLYPWMPQGGTALEVVSSSASDAAAGTGIRTLILQLLDSNYLASTIPIVLNGTTAVAVPGGAKWLRVNGMIITSAGSNGTNVGTVTLRDTGGGTTRTIMGAGYGIARQAVYTVPAGSTLSINSQVFSIITTLASLQGVTVAGYIQSMAGGVTYYRMPLELSTTDTYRHDGVPGIILTEKTDFAHRCTASGNTVSLSTGFLGVLRDNRVG